MSEADAKEREEFREKLNQLWLCILGNGHPEEGLKWKVEQNAIKLQEMYDFTRVVKGVFWKVIATCIVGTLSALGLLIWRVVGFLFQQNVL